MGITNSHQRSVLLQHYASDLDLALIWLYGTTSHNSHAHLQLLKCRYLGKCLTTASKQQVQAWSAGSPSSAQLEITWSFRPGNARRRDTSWVLSLSRTCPGTDVWLKNSFSLTRAALQDQADSSTLRLLSLCSPAATCNGYLPIGKSPTIETIKSILNSRQENSHPEVNGAMRVLGGEQTLRALPDG